MHSSPTGRVSMIRPRVLGFSVVELLVAVALSLLLLVGVMAIFASSRSSYETTDRLSRIQENGRFALDQLTQHIRSAGFVGCARQPTYASSSLTNATTVLQWNFMDGPVRGFQSTSATAWSPTIDASVTSPSGGSDVLVLRVPARDAEPLRLTADMTSGTDTLTVPNVTNGVQTGDVALAYSCEAQSYFHVSSFAGGVIGHAVSTGTPGNADNTINYAFRRNAEVIPVETVIYYIRESTGVAAGTLPAGTTSLWRRVGLADAQELVEGVERMELEFGVDTNGDTIVDAYQTANAVTNWGNVFSVSVALLVRSLEQYGADTDQRTYQLLNVSVPAPADRRMREVFAATASIRNRVRVN